MVWRKLWHIGAEGCLFLEPIVQETQIKNPQPGAEGCLFGAPGGIRTPDQVVRSHLLYPAELRVRDFTRYLVLITS